MGFDPDKYLSRMPSFQEIENTNSLKDITSIPLDKIKPNPINAQIFKISDAAVKRVAESIEHRGFVGAAYVYDMGDGTYELYSGHIRYEALKLLNRSAMPCHVKPYPESEKEMAYDLISENADGRGSLSPIEQARFLEYWKNSVLADFSGKKTKELARRFGMGESSVKRYLRLLKLSPELQDKISKGVSYAALANASTLSEKDQAKLNERLDSFIEKNGEDKVTIALVDTMIESIKNKDEKKPVREKSKRLPKACTAFLTALNKKKEEYTEDEKALLRASLIEIKEKIEEQLNDL